MDQSSDQIAEQFLQLMHKFIRLRPRLIVSAEFKHLKKRIQKLKSGAGGVEGRHQLLRVLMLIAESPAPPTMGDLSAGLGMPLSSSTRIIDGIVKAGFVERVNDGSDRRLVRVQMTETGQELFQTSVSYNKQRIQHILGKFTPDEQAQLLKLMTKLFDSLVNENRSVE